MHRILVLQPFGVKAGHDFDRTYGLMSEAIRAAGSDVETVRLDDLAAAGSVEDALQSAIAASSLVVCDVTFLNPYVMYQAGFAHALGKPTLMLAARGESLPFDLRSVRFLVYDPAETRGKWVGELTQLVRRALDQPSDFVRRSVPPDAKPISKVFISYSHADASVLKRLLVHLRPLERKGLIDPWADTKLKAGDRWREEIEAALGRARVAVLLITADFLASEFVVSNELPALLRKAESEGTKIIPVIVKACRFARDTDLSAFQAINEPHRPLLSLAEADQEVLYDRIAEAVEQSVAVV